jgi:hypothetical protein
MKWLLNWLASWGRATRTTRRLEKFLDAVHRQAAEVDGGSEQSAHHPNTFAEPAAKQLPLPLRSPITEADRGQRRRVRLRVRTGPSRTIRVILIRMH